MKEFKVGDRVFDIRYGWGVIRDIKEGRFSIRVDFETSLDEGYMSDGRWRGDENISLFHEEYGPNHDDAKEFPRLMEVSNNGEYWYKTEVFAIGKGLAFANNVHGQVSGWTEYREIQEPEVIELTIDQIAEKFGTKAELIKIKK